MDTAYKQDETKLSLEKDDVTTSLLQTNLPTSENTSKDNEKNTEPLLPAPKKTLKQRLLKLHGFFFGIMSALFLSLSHIFVKKAKFFSGSEQSSIRYLLQFFVLALVACITKNNILGSKDSRKILLIRGSFGMLALIAMSFSVKFIDPSDSLALFNLNLVIVSILARFYLKEKMNIAKILSVFMSIIGVFLIAQPSFLFPNKKLKKMIVPKLNLTNSSLCFQYAPSNSSIYDILSEPHLNLNQTLFLANCTQLHLAGKQILHQGLSAGVRKILGISIALFGALMASVNAILLKKLSNINVHFSVVTIYASYFGFPVSVIISLIIIFTGAEKKDPKHYESATAMLIQIAFSLTAAFAGIFSQALWSISLKYEDTSKISILKSTDLLFTYIFQMLILNIYSNAFSTIGAFLIFSGSLLILIFKMVDSKLSNNQENVDKKQPLWKKILLFKF